MRQDSFRNQLRPRGWSVLQVGSRLGSLQRTHDQYLRELWATRRNGALRVALVLVGVWVAYSLVGSNYGLLRLRKLHQQESELTARVAALTEETARVHRLRTEDAATEAERPMRETYRRSRPNEIIYRIEKVRADSAVGGAGDGSGGRGAEEGGSGR